MKLQGEKCDETYMVYSYERWFIYANVMCFLRMFEPFGFCTRLVKVLEDQLFL